MSKQERITPLLDEAILHQRRIRELVGQIELILVDKAKDPECLTYESITNYIIEHAYEDESEDSVVRAKQLITRTSRELRR
jgi:hypothetical protein